MHLICSVVISVRMKYFITLLLIGFTSLGFAQNSGLIVGKVLDKELNNEPLMFASISIKGSSIKSTSDVTGLFYIENLQDGPYTLVCSFPGYETKEIKVQVNGAQTSDVKLALAAKTISLNELASLKNPS